MLKGKAKVLGTIEELERLTPLLKEALVEERTALEASAQSAAERKARAHAEQEAATKFAALEEVSHWPLWACAYLSQLVMVVCYCQVLTDRDTTADHHA